MTLIRNALLVAALSATTLLGGTPAQAAAAAPDVAWEITRLPGDNKFVGGLAMLPGGEAFVAGTRSVDKGELFPVGYGTIDHRGPDGVWRRTSDVPETGNQAVDASGPAGAVTAGWWQPERNAFHTRVWDGAVWRDEFAPAPAGTSWGVLNAVVDLGSHDKWAVGIVDTDVPGEPDKPSWGIAFHWDGRAWTEVPLPPERIPRTPPQCARPRRPPGRRGRRR